MSGKIKSVIPNVLLSRSNVKDKSMMGALLLLLAFLLLLGITAAEEHSVVAGDWRVTFSTNTPVSTNVMWTESNDLKNDGFFTVWINTSYQVSGIALLELPEGVHTYVSRVELENVLQSMTPKALIGSPINNLKIDSKPGLITHGWDDQLATTAYAVVYPADLTPDNITATIVGYVSFIGENPSMEIINSLHVERSNTSSQPTQASAISNTLPIHQAAGTRDDPIQMGTPVDTSDGWQITVLDVVPDATNIVLKENTFNNPPKQGYQFFLARIQAKYTGTGSAKFDGNFRLRAVGPSAVGYTTFENSPGVIPDPIPDSEVFSGGVITGNVGWEIQSSDANALVMYDEPFSLSSNNKGRVFMALFGQGTGAINSQINDQKWVTQGYGKMGRY